MWTKGTGIPQGSELSQCLRTLHHTFFFLKWTWWFYSLKIYRMLETLQLLQPYISEQGSGRVLGNKVGKKCYQMWLGRATFDRTIFEWWWTVIRYDFWPASHFTGEAALRSMYIWTPSLYIWLVEGGACCKLLHIWNFLRLWVKDSSSTAACVGSV